jgi:predicted AlkP superfamily pyrophosphatase or phosphodiesterase
MKRFAFAVAAALLLTFSTSCFAAEQPSHPLIFISIDGYRADYIKRGLSPTLKTLIAGGVYANAMRPSFPSVTEPNHYTLLTGLRPDHHGVIDNSMIDPAIPGERFGEGAMFNDDPRWWAEATPLWVSAEKQGEIVAASGFPGTEALNHDTKPNYLQTWNPDLTPARQTEIVLGWLSLPADVRPSMILLHYDPVDNMGHAHGPDSPELNGALRDVDAALAKLVSGLKARKLYDSTNIVIVSDHGMTATSADRVIYLDDLFDVSHAIVPSMGAYGGVDPLPGHEAEIAAALLTHHDHMTCWKKSEIPAALHYGTNSARAGDLLPGGRRLAGRHPRHRQSVWTRVVGQSRSRSCRSQYGGPVRGAWTVVQAGRNGARLRQCRHLSAARGAFERDPARQ